MLKFFIKFSLFFLSFAPRFLGISALVFAQIACNSAFAKAQKEAPTKIRSDIMDIKRKSQTVNFIGNVVIEKEDSSLLSNRMTVLYEEKKDQQNGSTKDADDSVEESKQQNSATAVKKTSGIRRIYSDEKMKIFTDEFVATGDSGYYDPKEDLFVLEKNVMVNNGVSVAKGDKFIHHISTKKSNFVGQKDMVKEGVDNRVVVILGDDAKEFKQNKKKKNE